MTVDAIIILAKGVLSDGSLPALVQHEIDYALSYVQPAVTVIYTGTPAETAAMQAYAKPAHLLIDDQARDTIGSAVYTKILADQYHWQNLLVLATADHVNRAQYIFQHIYGAGYQLSYHSHQHIFTLPQYLKNKHYDWLASTYAKWWFWTLRDHSNAGLQQHLEHHHFMYRPTMLKWILKR